ncbi:MAG: nitroreductase [Smithella sp.]
MLKGGDKMEILDAIKKRRSIRGYKPDPVSKAVIREILEIAGRAPSAMNTQPWEFAVVTGEPLQKMREGNIEKIRSGASPQPEHQVAGWPNDSVYRARQVDLAKHIFQIMDISRKDNAKRDAWLERGFCYFDAPTAIIIYVDKTLPAASPAVDVGAVMQNICLAALPFGLGTCIHDQGIMYPDVVKRCTGIPESKRLIVAISIGYPDEDNIANKITSTRESIDKIISWIGFSD